MSEFDKKTMGFGSFALFYLYSKNLSYLEIRGGQMLGNRLAWKAKRGKRDDETVRIWRDFRIGHFQIKRFHYIEKCLHYALFHTFKLHFADTI